MKKNYIQPLMKNCNLYGETLLDDVVTTSVDVYTDDPQHPGDALGNEYGVWDDDDAEPRPSSAQKNVWER